jgi:hypothetical protein
MFVNYSACVPSPFVRHLQKHTYAQLETEVNIHRQQQEHEDARRLDIVTLQQQVEKVAHSDVEIVNVRQISCY